MNTRTWICGFLICFLVLTGIGCASTGRGSFPSFEHSNKSLRRLAVLPPIGISSGDLRNSIMDHVRRDSLMNAFNSVRVVSSDTAEETLRDNFTVARVQPNEARVLANEIDADWLLAFYVNDFMINEFSEHKTKTIVRIQSSRSEAEIFNGDGSQTVSNRETTTTTREVPVTQGKVRVVISLSALIYDLNTGKVIWRGRRIERVEDQLEDLSIVELKDIAVERVMYRIVSRLNA